MWIKLLVGSLVLIAVACEPSPNPPETEPSQSIKSTATPVKETKNSNSNKGSKNTLELLPKGEGYEIVTASCTGCHSAKLVTQNRMTRQDWDATLTWMQKKQGLWPLGDNRKIILDYLEKHFSPQQQNDMDGLGPRRVNILPEKIR